MLLPGWDKALYFCVYWVVSWKWSRKWLWRLDFVECVYSSGLVEKQGSLFLTGCFLLSPIVWILWAGFDQQQTEDYAQPNPGKLNRRGE